MNRTQVTRKVTNVEQSWQDPACLKHRNYLAFIGRNRDVSLYICLLQTFHVKFVEGVMLAKADQYQPFRSFFKKKKAGDRISARYIKKSWPGLAYKEDRA